MDFWKAIGAFLAFSALTSEHARRKAAEDRATEDRSEQRMRQAVADLDRAQKESQPVINRCWAEGHPEQGRTSCRES